LQPEPVPPAPDTGLVEEMRREIPANDLLPPEEPVAEERSTDLSDLALVLGSDSRVETEQAEEEPVEELSLPEEEPEAAELADEVELPEVSFADILSHVAQADEAPQADPVVDAPEPEAEELEPEVALDLSLFVSAEKYTTPEPEEVQPEATEPEAEPETVAETVVADAIAAAPEPVPSEPASAAEIWAQLTSGAERPRDVDGVIDAISRLLQIQSGETAQAGRAEDMPAATAVPAKPASEWDFLN